MSLKKIIRKVLIQESGNIDPYILRRLDLDKFNDLLDKGKVYMFYESNSLEEFKWKLVTATLENYHYYKYETDIDTSDGYFDQTIQSLVNLFEPKLETLYNRLKKERG
jgi:hypothetical protein